MHERERRAGCTNDPTTMFSSPKVMMSTYSTKTERIPGMIPFAGRAIPFVHDSSVNTLTTGGYSPGQNGLRGCTYKKRHAYVCTAGVAKNAKKNWFHICFFQTHLRAEVANLGSK